MNCPKKYTHKYESPICTLGGGAVAGVTPEVKQAIRDAQLAASIRHERAMQKGWRKGPPKAEEVGG
jgi:hypothetical protein